MISTVPNNLVLQVQSVNNSTAVKDLLMLSVQVAQFARSGLDCTALVEQLRPFVQSKMAKDSDRVQATIAMDLLKTTEQTVGAYPLEQLARSLGNQFNSWISLGTNYEVFVDAFNEFVDVVTDETVISAIEQRAKQIEESPDPVDPAVLRGMQDIRNMYEALGRSVDSWRGVAKLDAHIAVDVPPKVITPDGYYRIHDGGIRVLHDHTLYRKDGEKLVKFFDQPIKKVVTNYIVETVLTMDGDLWFRGKQGNDSKYTNLTNGVADTWVKYESSDKYSDVMLSDTAGMALKARGGAVVWGYYKGKLATQPSHLLAPEFDNVIGLYSGSDTGSIVVLNHGGNTITQVFQYKNVSVELPGKAIDTASQGFTYVITEDHRLWCINAGNQSSIPGDGSTDSSGEYRNEGFIKNIMPDKRFRMVFASSGYSRLIIAVTDDGVNYMWGYKDFNYSIRNTSVITPEVVYPQHQFIKKLDAGNIRSLTTTTGCVLFYSNIPHDQQDSNNVLVYRDPWSYLLLPYVDPETPLKNYISDRLDKAYQP